MTRIWNEWNVLIILCLLKLSIHWLTNTGYDFHRDEYLYLALGHHLSWGYMEVPPVIAVIARLAHMLGASLFITRLFPALIGTVTVWLIGVMVKDMGGKRWAQILACSAFILSPAFLRSNNLFQPVSFNQFFWFLAAFFIVRLITRQQAKYWYSIGLIAGIGLLTKYSIAFFLLSFIIAILLTPHRTWLKTRHPYAAVGIALAIFLPNLVWQLSHGLPIVHHMEELTRTQLIHVDIAGFLIDQLLSHHVLSIIWLIGLCALFFSRKLKPYRVLAWMYAFTLIILIIFSGKSYYAMGAYAMLFAAGGVVVARSQQNTSACAKAAILVFLGVVTLPVIPYGLPVLKIETMKRYCAFMKDRLGLARPLIWEDGQTYPLPQDFADMHGWEELAGKVGAFYHSLSPDERASCMIHGGGYSHASVLLYYQEKYDLPDVFSFNGSFIMWAPDSLDFDRQILVDDVFHTQSSWFRSMVLVDRIQNPNARDPGYIYYRTDPIIDVKQRWVEEVRERKNRFGLP